MILRQQSSNSEENFKKNLGLSAVVHALIFSLFFLKLAFFNEPSLDLSQAIQVDMVGLPDKPTPENTTALPEKNSLPEKKEPLPVKEVKKEVVEPNVVNLNKAKSKQKAALEKLKKLSAIDKIKQEVKTEAVNKAIIKGRVITAGTSLTGLDKLEANTYLLALDQQIKQQWVLPQWLIGKTLKTRVHVRFDASGKIISRVIMNSSGEPTYDDYCLQAVDKASPFPAVPEKFSEKFSVDGVVIGFPE